MKADARKDFIQGPKASADRSRGRVVSTESLCNPHENPGSAYGIAALSRDRREKSICRRKEGTLPSAPPQTAHSSRGLGHSPLKAGTRVRIPYALPALLASLRDENAVRLRSAPALLQNRRRRTVQSRVDMAALRSAPAPPKRRRRT